MSNDETPQNPKDIEIKKLKDILRNQIVEIKSLKKSLSEKSENSDSGNEESIKRINDEFQKKYEKINESKDAKIAALKRDLKLSNREIEGHLKRHNDELLKLHEKLISERTSRDFLLSTITTELIESVKISSRKKSKSPDFKDQPSSLHDEIDIKPSIEKVKLPEFDDHQAQGPKTILYVAPQIPNFDESSGGKRAYWMLKLLARKHNVICYSKRLLKEFHKSALEKEGVKVLNKIEPHHLIESIDQIDVIIAAWYYSYFDIQDVIRAFPKARLIVDSVDIHWVREERSIGNWKGIDVNKMEENKKNEIFVYEKADIVWVVTKEDRIAVKKELPYSDVRIVSNIHELKDNSFKESKSNVILFFGGFNHYPNINAVLLLVNNIFPKIKEQVNDAELVIAGSNAPEEILELGDRDGVTVAGFIPFEDLPELYYSSKLTIVPLTEGAGIKGKICEAIEYRVPVITNDIGNEGINLENYSEGFISNDYNEMALMAIDILNDAYDLKTITEAAQHKVKRLLGTEANLLVMEQSFIPHIDICIVSYNKKNILEKCIDSILSNTRYPHFNIIVYSNGCSDGTQEYLLDLKEKHDNVDIILSEINEIFVKPNNKMMLLNPDHDVVLLNNDVVVVENWLEGLVNQAYISDRIGIVGSKILNPDNTLQEFGSMLYLNGSGINFGKNDNPNKAKYLYSKKAAYVSGCSMYIKRNTINKIGVFDELYDPAYAEDSDYCYTAWENDIEVNVTPHSLVYHLEGASSGKSENEGFKKFQKINIQKFLSKHGEYVEEVNNRVESINEEYQYSLSQSKKV